MKNFYQGRWQAGSQTLDVHNPYTGETIGTVPEAGADEVDAALEGLVSGAETMRQLKPYERGEMLDQVSRLLAERAEEFARTVTSESGKTLSDARVEAQRAVETFRLSAEEARRLTGQTVPLEGTAGGANKLGFTIRIPCGIVAAISPFNFPLNLVAHKVGPALAGGNAVLCKPASDTPFTALKLIEILLESGVPENAVACLTGPGKTLGKAICSDNRVRKISFTGSYEVGDAICKTAGLKKVTMELGGNGPVIVMADADLKQAAAAISKAGYSNAGQVCISAQRILVAEEIHDDFLDALKTNVEQLKTGDPQAESTQMGPMIRENDAERVEEWVHEATSQGAKLITGGQRKGAFFSPTILTDGTDQMKVCREELFGPAVVLTKFQTLKEAIHIANATPYGLACGLFTQNLQHAMTFAQTADYGIININGSTQFRADLMPYGGLKHSGLGKEGPAYTIREMTEEKMVVFHLSE